MRSNIRFIMLTLFFFLLPCSAQPGQEQQTLHLSAILPRSVTFHGELAYRIYSAALERVGLQLKYEFFPARRANIMISRGELDGDIARSLQFGDENPSLIRVKEAGFSVRLSAYGKRNDIHLNGWESLHGTSLLVDCLDGYTQPRAHLEQVLKKNQLNFIAATELSFRRIVKDHTDIYVGVEEHAESLLKNPEFKHSGIHKVGGMGDELVYVYLHKKHESLAEQLAIELHKMKMEGLIDQITRQLKIERGLVEPNEPVRDQPTPN